MGDDELDERMLENRRETDENWDPHPNRFFEFWLYSHPSLEKRANFAAHYDPWKNGGHGEFFKK